MRLIISGILLCLLTAAPVRAQEGVQRGQNAPMRTTTFRNPDGFTARQPAGGTRAVPDTTQTLPEAPPSLSTPGRLLLPGGFVVDTRIILARPPAGGTRATGAQQPATPPQATVPQPQATATQDLLITRGFMERQQVNGRDDDDATRAALEEFQISVGLPVTGEVDELTQEALDQGFLVNPPRIPVTEKPIAPRVRLRDENR